MNREFQHKTNTVTRTENCKVKKDVREEEMMGKGNNRMLEVFQKEVDVKMSPAQRWSWHDTTGLFYYNTLL